MADKMYAWSPIVRDEGKPVKVGDSVSASDLGIEDEDFQALVDAGAVRKVKYPDIDPFISPREARLNALAAATEDALNNAWAEAWVPEGEEAESAAAATAGATGTAKATTK
jgi:hypothetical protein